MILVLLIPLAVIAMSLGVLAGYENNAGSIRFWKLVNSASCFLIALLGLSTEFAVPAFSISVALVMALFLLSEYVRNASHKGSLQRLALILLVAAVLYLNPDTGDAAATIFFGGGFVAVLIVSLFASRSSVSPGAQFLSAAPFVLAAAAQLGMLGLVRGAALPMLWVSAGFLFLHGLERTYFPAGFFKTMRTGDMTLMTAYMLISIIPGMIGIEGGWLL
ncbi:hypothetical protein [Spirochaeta dissipatitropha]